MKYTIHSLWNDGGVALEYTGDDWQAAGEAVTAARNHGADSVMIRFVGTISEAAEPAASPAPKPGTVCEIHGVQMERFSNDRGSWYSHRLDEGGFCKGKPRSKQKAYF